MSRIRSLRSSESIFWLRPPLVNTQESRLVNDVKYIEQIKALFLENAYFAHKGPQKFIFVPFIGKIPVRGPAHWLLSDAKFAHEY